MNQTSLLSGNIRQQILTLAVPLLLGNILQQLYNTADSLIVGRFLGTNAFASVGISGSLMNLFIFILDGFCAGITVILGQFYGSGDRKKYREEVFTALLLGMIIALIISSVCTVFLNPILSLIRTNSFLTLNPTFSLSSQGFLLPVFITFYPESCGLSATPELPCLFSLPPSQ